MNACFEVIRLWRGVSKWVRSVATLQLLVVAVYIMVRVDRRLTWQCCLMYLPAQAVVGKAKCRHSLTQSASFPPTAAPHLQCCQRAWTPSSWRSVSSSRRGCGRHAQCSLQLRVWSPLILVHLFILILIVVCSFSYDANYNRQTVHWIVSVFTGMNEVQLRMKETNTKDNRYTHVSFTHKIVDFTNKCS